VWGSRGVRADFRGIRARELRMIGARVADDRAPAAHALRMIDALAAHRLRMTGVPVARELRTIGAVSRARPRLPLSRSRP